MNGPCPVVQGMKYTVRFQACQWLEKEHIWKMQICTHLCIFDQNLIKII